MRQAQKGKRGKPRKKTGPLAEGIRRTKRGRDWASMSDDELVDYAHVFVREKGLKGKTGMQKAGSGLYGALWKRKLLNIVFPESAERRDWASMSDEEIFDYARRIVDKDGLESRIALSRSDLGLYKILKIRGLLEKIIPDSAHKSRRPARNWASMSDEELVSFAKAFMRKKRITGKRELERTDAGLFSVLSRRGLLDSVGFEEKHRNWTSMSDEEILELAKEVVLREGVGMKQELRKVDRGLLAILERRELLDSLEFVRSPQKGRNWASMSDEKLVEFAQRVVKEKGLQRRGELAEADSGLYTVLLQRKLIDRIGIETTRRDWESLDDEEIVGFAKDLIKEKGITRRKELEKTDAGLYTILGKRGLRDRIGLTSSYDQRKDARDWKSMSDDELVAFARRVVKEKRLQTRSDLGKVDSGLYAVLKRRKLMDQVIPESALNGNRDWVSMSDEEIVAFAKKFVEERGIATRDKLRRANGKLHSALHRRKLMDQVIPESAHSERRKTRNWRSMSDEEIVAIAKDFIEKKGITARDELKEADPGLCSVLYRRKLMDEATAELVHGGKKNHRSWESMSDEEIVEYAREFIEKEGISGKGRLQRVARGLYKALRKRKLLDRVGFEEKQRNWKSMTDEEIVAIAKDFIEERGITARIDLQRIDVGLHSILYRRELLGRVFSHLESDQQKQAVREVVEAMKEFDSS